MLRILHTRAKILRVLRESLGIPPLPQGGTAKYDDHSRILKINDEFTALVTVVPCCTTRAKSARWKLGKRTQLNQDVTIAARMNESNTEIRDYLILPRIDIQDRRIWFWRQLGVEFDAYRYDTLDPFFALCVRHTMGTLLG